MSERRQVHRREPIIVVMDDGKEFEARPLPWLQRNDLGNEIVTQNARVINEFVKVWVDESSGLPQLEASFHEKLTDIFAVIALAYPTEDVTKLSELTHDELLELVYAALEVNSLTHLRPLVDPNSPTPTMLGGTDTSAGMMTQDGQKTESSTDSSSEDLVEMPSST